MFEVVLGFNPCLLDLLDNLSCMNEVPDELFISLEDSLWVIMDCLLFIKESLRFDCLNLFLGWFLLGWRRLRWILWFCMISKCLLTLEDCLSWRSSWIWRRSFNQTWSLIKSRWSWLNHMSLADHLMSPLVKLFLDLAFEVLVLLVWGIWITLDVDHPLFIVDTQIFKNALTVRIQVLLWVHRTFDWDMSFHGCINGSLLTSIGLIVFPFIGKSVCLESLFGLLWWRVLYDMISMIRKRFIGI